jgi:hypothetical protein
VSGTAEAKVRTRVPRAAPAGTSKAGASAKASGSANAGPSQARRPGAVPAAPPGAPSSSSVTPASRATGPLRPATTVPAATFPGLRKAKPQPNLEQGEEEWAELMKKNHDVKGADWYAKGVKSVEVGRGNGQS